jgi:hypothetical protein
MITLFDDDNNDHFSLGHPQWHAATPTMTIMMTTTPMTNDSNDDDHDDDDYTIG